MRFLFLFPSTRWPDDRKCGKLKCQERFEEGKLKIKYSPSWCKQWRAIIERASATLRLLFESAIKINIKLGRKRAIVCSYCLIKSSNNEWDFYHNFNTPFCHLQHFDVTGRWASAMSAKNKNTFLRIHLYAKSFPKIWR